MPSPSNSHVLPPVDSYFQSHARHEPTTFEIWARYDDPPSPPAGDDTMQVNQFHPHRPPLSLDEEMMCYTATSTLTRSGQKRDSFAMGATALLDFSRIGALQAFVPLEVSSLYFSLFQQTLRTGLLVPQAMPVLNRPRVDVFDAALLFVDMSGSAQSHSEFKVCGPCLHSVLGSCFKVSIDHVIMKPVYVCLSCVFIRLGLFDGNDGGLVGLPRRIHAVDGAHESKRHDWCRGAVTAFECLLWPHLRTYL